VSTFEETLGRVLDPEGIYWIGVDEGSVDPAEERTVQLRIDVPLEHVATAVAAMERDGWIFTEQPDDSDDPQQRLFFRRRQNLLPQTKVTMLTNALRVVAHIEGGRLWTWIIADDENEA
jgi:hypothetical protein